jgi:hypothetical protein
MWQVKYAFATAEYVSAVLFYVGCKVVANQTALLGMNGLREMLGILK